LPSVPAGSYTLRALGAGHLPAPARHITVLPNHEASYTVSLIPVGDDKADAVASAKAQVQEEEKDDPPSLAELRWLLRHKRRPVEPRGTGGGERERELAHGRRVRPRARRRAQATGGHGLRDALPAASRSRRAIQPGGQPQRGRGIPPGPVAGGRPGHDDLGR